MLNKESPTSSSIVRGIFKQSVEQFKMTFFIEKYGRL